jgi:cytochrome P450
MIKRTFDDTVNRMSYITYILFPRLIRFPITFDCQRYKRNVASVRAAMQQIMDERRSGACKRNFQDCEDILDILLSSPLYLNDDEKLKDELYGIFVGGNDTIKTSTTNTICYLAMHPEIKAKFMAEVTPILDSVSDDFINKLD